MVTAKEFVRRLRQLPNLARPQAEVDRLVQAYRDLMEEARKHGARRVGNGASAIRQHIEKVLANKPESKIAGKDAARMFLAVERATAAGVRHETLVQRAHDALRAPKKSRPQSRTTGTAMRSVLATWDKSGATLSARLQSLIELRNADRAVASPEPSQKAVRAEWGSFRTKVRGRVSVKRLAALRQTRELLPAYPRLRDGVLHSALTKEGK